MLDRHCKNECGIFHSIFILSTSSRCRNDTFINGIMCTIYQYSSKLLHWYCGHCVRKAWMHIIIWMWCMLMMNWKYFQCYDRLCYFGHGPHARYVKLRVAHAPGMPGTFSPPPRLGDPDMYHGTCVTHEPWCVPGSLTSGFLWIWWRGKRSRHSRRMRKPQFNVSGKRPIADLVQWLLNLYIWLIISNSLVNN